MRIEIEGVGKKIVVEVMEIVSIGIFKEFVLKEKENMGWCLEGVRVRSFLKVGDN